MSKMLGYTLKGLAENSLRIERVDHSYFSVGQLDTGWEADEDGKPVEYRRYNRVFSGTRSECEGFIAGVHYAADMVLGWEL